MRVAVTGANSSVGLNLLAHLAGLDGSDIVACVRSERAAATVPHLSGVRPHVASYGEPEKLASAMKGARAVIHLAGILVERGDQRYEAANVGTARAAATAAVRAGVEHLVLVSVIGADPGSSNPYLRSKGQAEQAVADSGIASTILRTPILLGPGTAGAESLARATGKGAARLLGGGTYTMRPLDLDDLSRAIISTLQGSPRGVETLELVGPEPLTYRELVERHADARGTHISFRSTPIWLAKLGAFVSSRIKGGGVTPAVIDVITSDEVVERNADARLGLTLTPLSETLRKIIPAHETTT